MENLGRCPRCHKFMIAEQNETHVCDFMDLPLYGCEELVLHRLTDSGEDKNGDHLYLAWGINGILYRLLVCKHNPSHSTKRRFTGEDAKQGLDSPGQADSSVTSHERNAIPLRSGLKTANHVCGSSGSSFFLLVTRRFLASSNSP